MQKATLILLLILTLLSGASWARMEVTIGVDFSDGELSAGWQRMAKVLTEKVGKGIQVNIVELQHNEVALELEHHRLDFLLTDPATYVQLKERNALAHAVATVRGLYRGRPVFSQAGVIVVRKGRKDIISLNQLRGKRVAIVGTDHLSTFQAQASMLLEQDVDILSEIELVTYPVGHNDTPLGAVLGGDVDAAFLRAGLLEEMAERGQRVWDEIDILNNQHLPGFPYAVSTRLYPERPLVVMPHVAPKVAQRLVTALYSLEAGSSALTDVNLYHIKLPEDYTSVANVARDLHLPPFDVIPELTLDDVWHRYSTWIVTFIIVALLISTLATTLLFANRRLQREIAGRKYAESSLKRSEHSLAEAQRLAHLGNWVLDITENNLSWTDEVYRIFEIEPKELAPSYELFIEAVHPEDRHLVNEAFSQALNSGGIYSIEHRLLLKDGRIKYVHERGETLYNEDGEPIKSVGTVLDITERKMAELKHKEANERFELAMKASNDGLWDWNVETGHVYYSPRWLSMLGYTVDELAYDFATWEKCVDQSDHGHVMMLIDKCINGQSDGFVTEFRMRHKDGRWIDVLSRGISVRDDNGQVNRFVGTHVDISERKQLERSLREQERELNTILDQIPNILFVKEAKELRYVRFNRSGEEKLGLEHGYFIGKNDYDVFPVEMAEEFVRADRAALESDVIIDIPEEVINTPSGERVMHTRKLAIKNEQGEPIYLLGVSEDITDKKASEDEKERLQSELQQAQKMESLGQLTGGIAHDFNNLLGIINGYAGLAYDNCLNRGEEKLAGYMQHLKDASDRATNLVAQMLAFSRSEQVDDMPIQMAPLVKEDIKMLRATLPATIEMKTEVASGLPPVVMNPTQLHQILMNLSINARDAMKGEGALSINLGWARDMDDISNISHKPVKGDWIELSVSDNGSGIDAETAQKIFNPFFTTKDVGKGTGMGLSVIYGIMEKHHGHILLESELGKGSTFRMLFAPYKECEGDLGHTEIPVISNLPQGDNSEILVVDDELTLGIFMAELLKSNGYRAVSVTDSREALQMYLEDPNRFSMLITDQTMPHLAGTELIAAIRETKPDFPVILCTGYSDKIDATGASDLDIPFFEKPINEVKLLIKISELLSL